MQVKVVGKNKDFNTAVKVIKKNGGTYDAVSKTWTMPDNDNLLTMWVGYIARVSQPTDLYRDWSDNPDSNL